ncbi:MAG TPA: S-layer glycoprotein N-glycosyltransferase AglJ, partial [Methanomicrobiales archaeon]|nr:S-layer glycoprotein N-glycosyltransferase AglJ [Methanomicrobiales archaeon]
DFKNLGYSHIFVMDGGSTDGTIDIAKAAGATVHVQSRKGKGNAIIEALDIIDRPYVLMLDGDGTYSCTDAEKMIQPLFRGYDHVIGNRLDSAGPGAFSRLNLFGNRLINWGFKVAHRRDLKDILSGYRAFSLDSMRQMHLKEEGFEIETEMSVGAVRNNQRVMVVPVAYAQRAGTNTKLNPFQDGVRITGAVYRLAKTNNPLFYFGLVGIVITIFGSLTGVYVLSEWLRGIEHIPLTILTVLLITVGFEIFMFGVISDMMLSFHREVIREIQLQQPPKPPQ